jgi:hypothetical protein
MSRIQKPTIELNLGKYNAGDRILISNEFAKYEMYISELEAEHRRELAEKDKMIRYYARHDELATERKKRAIINADRKAKLNFSYAALLIAAMCLIPWVLWLVDLCAKEFWLWAQGR